MSRVGSQRQRLLTWAERGGSIRQTDWAANAPDGGDPILRVAAVVGALERGGHRFKRCRLGNGSVQYELVRRGTPPASQADPDPEQFRLIEIDPTPGCALRGPDA